MEPDSLPCTLVFYVNSGIAEGTRSSMNPASLTLDMNVPVAPITASINATLNPEKDGSN